MAVANLFVPLGLGYPMRIEVSSQDTSSLKNSVAPSPSLFCACRFRAPSAHPSDCLLTCFTNTSQWLAATHPLRRMPSLSSDVGGCRPAASPCAYLGYHFFSNIDTSFHDRGPKFVIFVKKNLNGIVFVSRLYAPLPPFVRTMRGPGRGSLTIFQRLVLVLRVPYV